MAPHKCQLTSHAAGPPRHRRVARRRPHHICGQNLWLSFAQEWELIRSGGGTYALKDGVNTAHVDDSNATDLREIVGLGGHGTFRPGASGGLTEGAVFDEHRE